MDGLDLLGTHDVKPGTLLGFDYMSLLSGGAGLLSGAGGLMSGGGGAGGGGAAAAAEKQRLQDEKARAEKSASTMKTILIVVGSIAGLGLIAVLAGGRAPAAALPAVVK
jgi:hypothetical protein